MVETIDTDALRQEFADYCVEVEPGIKARAPKLNQLETLAIIAMTLFQACKELKAEKAEQAARITALESERDALLAAAGREAVGSREAFESAWNQKNGQENWGHEPTAKGLFEDGWNAAFHAGARPVPEGFRIVPIEPTMEMLIAARNADREYQSRMGLPDYVGVGGYDHYVAMLEVDPIARTAPTAALEKGDGMSLRAQYEDACIAANKNARDAERYRMIRNQSDYWREHGRQNVIIGMFEEDLDAAIDAALANQKQAG